ncbi:aromatic acid decarboxylase [Candidatus Poribacteria bacterium]|nr:aromatic acid decarboxylase [Candidatus Poribacteria bacterium]MAP91475.1 aromatic acid decarboxylase [Candidatus Poribacteria bacterium]MCH2576644.1 UbiX family flavin prenyltransferase [Candidatus Poribacteria bacterium]OUT63150.1 MAG: aromatic acid decarboxylase [bacterium TMED15]|tara:strand:- start:192 stop:794 length:603 start_codon:yes stop_codon:yes gene_type:complete
MKRIIVGLTGASGTVYGTRLVEVLADQTNFEVHLTISPAGARSLLEEVGIDIDVDNFELSDLIGRDADNVIYHSPNDIGASIASGSFRAEGMVIIPCSMGTVASVAMGLSRNLLQRSADVCMKERRKLVLVVRETPFSTIHLENMLKLSKNGVTILPAMPAFYHFPDTIDDQINFVVSKTLDQFGIEAGLIRRWKEKNST